MLDKGDFRTGEILQGIRRYILIMRKGSVHWEDPAVLNVCASSDRAKEKLIAEWSNRPTHNCGWKLQWSLSVTN